MSLVTRYLRVQDGLSEFVGQVICWLTLVMIGVLMFEIVARYFLNAPTLWAHESSTMLYGAFCMLAGAYTLKHRGHVRSEVIWGALPKRGQAFCDVLIFGAGAVVLVIFLKLAIDFATASWAVLEYSNKSMWQPPLYPIKTVIPVAVALILLQNMAELLRALLTLFNVDFEDPRGEEVDTSIAQELLGADSNKS
ncbi:C4-dicarboxylate ABC transporter substrate-binding protein [Roseobacter denitrificans]|uniref:TRAP transporter small permease protein n=1 Tax=Roseobacter denitrificans (strain ATCC 33942 / OCh 114) TaxID=375451 RepID=Q16BX3_ROSDO|nr:TRAP transporter small permease subunit [Roseobacter denitrificans]ABG30520.1 TRAP dicarboxylate transporter, DctQ subunit, putative [Roseobacter denitrificans OCh 114]AVL53672.1 C4-dicarboxylate ABC transporter substrate-binding protein [Roseobacter denitrificans]SFF73729.1 TRAP-type mannitol/chloroaromatic compound transport system, small permease component [Roseobacter denitrificans OCh 114]